MKKYIYRVGLYAEDDLTGEVPLTKKEAKFLCTVMYSDWLNRVGGGWCGSFRMDVEPLREATEKEIQMWEERKIRAERMYGL